jgi:hypothetical protein
MRFPQRSKPVEEMARKRYDFIRAVRVLQV